MQKIKDKWDALLKKLINETEEIVLSQKLKKKLIKNIIKYKKYCHHGRRT